MSKSSYVYQLSQDLNKINILHEKNKHNNHPNFLSICMWGKMLKKLFESFHASPLFFISSSIVDPSFAGDRVTATPAASSDSIFVWAPPFPPEMIAPA